jgi:hypothetical protein
MTIEVLTDVVPPPETPFEAFGGPWEPIEKEAGSPLPQDYKDFARLYGSGYFMEFLGVSMPRSANPNTCFEAQLKQTCDTFLGLDDLPYAMWPEPGGLIPFGSSDDGDFLFWLPRGAPNEWPVVIWSRGLLKFEVVEHDLTGFLAAVASGEPVGADFPEPSFFEDAEPFQPHSP